MPPGPAREKLRKMFPTLAAWKEGLQKYGTQKEMGRVLGINPTTVYEHKKWLETGRKPVKQKSKRTHEITNTELDEKIRSMFGNKYAEVKVYRLTDDYVPHQLGTEGLEYLRTEVSPTTILAWRNKKYKGEDVYAEV